MSEEEIKSGILKAEFCDEYCRYPGMLKDQIELEHQCELCPLEQLESKDNYTMITTVSSYDEPVVKGISYTQSKKEFKFVNKSLEQCIETHNILKNAAGEGTKVTSELFVQNPKLDLPEGIKLCGFLNWQ